MYELRLGNAHLQAADMNKSFALASIDPSVSTIRQAMQMMETTVKTFEAMSDVLEESTLAPHGDRTSPFATGRDHLRLRRRGS